MKLAGFLLLAALLLATAAASRAPEYDEAYSMFLTAGDARPAWPAGVFTPASVQNRLSGAASFAQISRDLKQGDVHPPLYFWALELWRRVAGPSWPAARLLSVGFTLAALFVLARLARASGTPVYPALFIALLSYGFAYTGIIARGFALAQALDLAGVLCLLRATQTRRWNLALAGGLAFGLASFTNYLAVFVAMAAVFWLVLARKRWRFVLPVLAGLLPFIPLDAAYFLAQRSSRAAQFASFSPTHAFPLLLKDGGAALFGGLPLYAGRAGPAVACLLLLLFLLCLSGARGKPYAGLFALSCLAPPAGLVALGMLFHNTPIEIRYLAFSLPYAALLLAWALRPLLAVLLPVQAAAILGLAFAPATMQPQGLAARQIAALNRPDALILLPFGNDGVGVPGPFLAAAPRDANIEILRGGAAGGYASAPVIILARITPDAASRQATRAALLALAADKCLRPAPAPPLAALFYNRCADQKS